MTSFKAVRMILAENWTSQRAISTICEIASLRSVKRSATSKSLSEKFDRKEK
jgi:hypothetical protein